MAQICKRSIDFTTNISSKKYKPGENLDNFKIQLEKILQDIPIGHKNLAVHSRNSSNSNRNSRQNLVYLTGAPKKQRGNSSAKSSSDLSETDLKVLLQNFYKLEGGEQQILIGHLKKLESNKPELVEDLKRFVRVSSPLPENEDIAASDCDLNDLDDLDDILEEGEIITDSESDDDCILVNTITTKLQENRKAIESTKNIIEILENTLEKDKIKNINLWPKKLAKENKEEFKKQDQQKKVPEMSQKQKIKKKGINKDQEYNIKQYEQNWKKERRKFDYSVSQEMQAIQFGYKNYQDMKEYLKNTGTIYCGANYVSFSDN